VCELAHRKAYYQEHAERQRASSKKWKAEHPRQDAARKKLWRQTHREQVNQSKRKWNAAHKSQIQNYFRRGAYGVLPEEYARRAAEQGGVCAICLSKCPTGRALAVDHSHLTGKVRGLLCNRCNTGLGSFKDNPARLRKAAEYIESWGG
jgi:hypothetical protein